MFCAAPNGAWWIGKMDLAINVSRLKGAGAAPGPAFQQSRLDSGVSHEAELATRC
jgi:hypothetical protein